MDTYTGAVLLAVFLYAGAMFFASLAIDFGPRR
jgi:hypothetical protein